MLKRATPGEVAAELGLTADSLPERCYDVVVVGAGPSGLAASVYAASEGLQHADASTWSPSAARRRRARGSRTTSGSPPGSPVRTWPSRAAIQAQKFGAVITSPCAVASLCEVAGHLVATLTDGTEVGGRALVAATGAHYRKLPVADLDRYEMAGVYYAATELEARMCAAAPIVVVGGGNSAGQAAMFLAEKGSSVCVVVRRPLQATMSQYLVDRIAAHPRIEVHPGMEVDRARRPADARADHRQRQRRRSSTSRARRCSRSSAPSPTAGGSTTSPSTTTASCSPTAPSIPPTSTRAWTTMNRRPLPYETSRPGLFAVGDLRAGSTKRVAAAVGEGSAAIRSVHEHLAGTS